LKKKKLAGEDLGESQIKGGTEKNAPDKGRRREVVGEESK